LRPRYQFYLAQSYRDCGEKEKAVTNYLKRAHIKDGYLEERYVSLVNAARLIGQRPNWLEENFTAVMEYCRQASALVPARAEALHLAARACRLASLFSEGYAIARKGIALKEPHGLFVESWVYHWGLLDEFSVNAYWAGHYAEAYLAGCNIPTLEVDENNRSRIQKNIDFARAKLC
jgi:hypothetical protein